MVKEKHPVDDFFRKSLQGHQIAPSSVARGSFLEEAALAGGKGWSGLLRWYILLPAVTIIAVSVFLFSRSSREDASLSPKITSKHLLPATEISQGPVSPVNTDSSANRVIKAPKGISAKPINKRYSKTSKHPFQAVSQIGVTSQKSTDETLVNPAETGPKNGISGNPGNTVAATGIQNSPAQPGTGLIALPGTRHDSLFNAGIKPAETPELTDKSGSAAKSSPDKDDKIPQYPGLASQSSWNFTPYLRYSLDWNLKGTENKLVHSLAVEGKIQRGRFSILSGAAISVSNGYHQYEVSYNDYLGQYKKLDSITFTLAADRFHLVPSYYSTDTKVWDSSLKLDNYQVEQRYHLVSVPVMLGYDLLNKGRITMGLKAGVEMTFYLDAHVLRGEYSAGQKKIVRVNSIADDLGRTNFCGKANLSFDCLLTKRLVFELEPDVQYLLNPAKGNSEVTKQKLIPGIRTSLKLKL